MNFTCYYIVNFRFNLNCLGEYIALYQAQRSLLQQRAIEKDHQVAAIAKEKEELRAKLNQLSSLVPQLVSNNSGIDNLVDYEIIRIELA